MSADSAEFEGRGHHMRSRPYSGGEPMQFATAQKWPPQLADSASAYLFKKAIYM